MRSDRRPTWRLRPSNRLLATDDKTGLSMSRSLTSTLTCRRSLPSSCWSCSPLSLFFFTSPHTASVTLTASHAPAETCHTRQQQQL